MFSPRKDNKLCKYVNRCNVAAAVLFVNTKCSVNVGS